MGCGWLGGIAKAVDATPARITLAMSFFMRMSSVVVGYGTYATDEDELDKRERINSTNRRL